MNEDICLGWLVAPDEKIKTFGETHSQNLFYSGAKPRLSACEKDVAACFSTWTFVKLHHVSSCVSTTQYFSDLSSLMCKDQVVQYILSCFRPFKFHETWHTWRRQRNVSPYF